MNAPAGMPPRFVRPRLGTIGLALAVAVLLAASFGLSRIAGWIPRAVLSVTLVLIFIQFGIEMREGKNVAPPARPGPGAEARVGSATPAVATAWIGVALLAVLVFGTAAGSALFAAAYLRWHARESWATCGVFALALGAFLQLLFGELMRATLYAGWLRQFVG